MNKPKSRRSIIHNYDSDDENQTLKSSQVTIQRREGNVVFKDDVNTNEFNDLRDFQSMYEVVSHMVDKKIVNDNLVCFDAKFYRCHKKKSEKNYTSHINLFF